MELEEYPDNLLMWRPHVSMSIVLHHNCCELMRFRWLRRRSSSGFCILAGRELRNDSVRIIDASSPHPSARLHQRRPEPCIVRQGGMRSEVFARASGRQADRALLRGESLFSFPDKVDRAAQRVPVDDDLDLVSVPHAARLGRRPAPLARCGRYRRRSTLR